MVGVYVLMIQSFDTVNVCAGHELEGKERLFASPDENADKEVNGRFSHL